MKRFIRRWGSLLWRVYLSVFLVWDVFWAVESGSWWFWVYAAVMLLCLVSHIRVTRETRQRRMARAVDYSDEPIPPVNVRIEQPDGTVIPVELVYGGKDPVTEMHMWFAVTPVRSVGRLTADYVPKNTAIAIQKSIR